MTSMEKSRRWAMAVFTVLVIFWGDGRCAGAQGDVAKEQTVYVAIYSHIYSGDREKPIYLAATLSIRNIDPENALRIERVDYYDSKGQLIKKYLEEPLNLSALASTRYIIKESDKTGGSGAHFIVRWSAGRPVNTPLIESIMISTKSQSGVSFTSRGKAILTNN